MGSLLLLMRRTCSRTPWLRSRVIFAEVVASRNVEQRPAPSDFTFGRTSFDLDNVDCFYHKMYNDGCESGEAAI